ncbi:MAG: hypothetical protein NBV65_06825 [Burkholderiaceae bacterium]|nr:hypothetical protein [Burkholderiaceae bacterium]
MSRYQWRKWPMTSIVQRYRLHDLEGRRLVAELRHVPCMSWKVFRVQPAEVSGFVFTHEYSARTLERAQALAMLMVRLEE